MNFNITLGNPEAFRFSALTLPEIIFNQLPHRSEDACVLLGHKDKKIIDIKISELRTLICRLSVIIKEKNLKRGDTVLLASFYCSNELSNAILFSAFACMGIRIFIPMYPEASELDHWFNLTKFKAVIIPFKELLGDKRHEREKEVIQSFKTFCSRNQIPFYDSDEDFQVQLLIRQIKTRQYDEAVFEKNPALNTETEAVIFTTSGTSGKSKLIVYNQGAFSVSCQSWQQAGLFEPHVCGNPCVTPLFTHTIGIRSFINALWTGNPLCLLVVDWFLTKPEEARYMLLRMRPGHITGGPALFSMLIEFFRQFPELKIELRKNLKTLISIGAPYNNEVARQIKNALGLDLFNAFGTTETQMVLLNRPSEPAYRPDNLGSPLPGVSIGLKEVEHHNYEFHLRSPYQSSYIINEPPGDPYFFTGDLVSYNEPEKRFLFTGRKSTDFIKDEFGVKIPVNVLHQYYPWLYEISMHIEWVVMDKKPGLAALLFLSTNNFDFSSKQIREWLKCRNDVLKNLVEPFEFTHRHLERFAVVKADPPRTRKGTISRNNLLKEYENLICDLRNPFVSEKWIETVESEDQTMLYKYSDPRMAGLLETLKMDVRFEKGEKDFLFYNNNGTEEKVLDLVGGFGAGLLGHGQPEIKKTLQQFLNSGQPSINTQGSLYHFPSLLAKELNAIYSENTGKFFKVQFGNTGSEAVEIALHHAYFEWWKWIEKRRDEQLQLYGSLEQIDAAAIWEQNKKIIAEQPAAVIVINHCFHGYSSSARSLLNNKKQRFYFAGLLRTIPVHINDHDDDWKEQIENCLQNQCIILKTVCKENGSFVVKQEKFSNIIASMIEPVRGEGGIEEMNWEVADFLSTQKFPLIADEIQCGLGRTGFLPSYPKASYYLLGKSLGGGFEKISAVLISDDHFKIDFPQYYTSTFANGELATCVALAAIKIIRQENVPEKARERGYEFKRRLNSIAAQFPDVISSVTGKGLMLAVNFNKTIGDKNIFLRALCENELLGYLAAGWLFHNKKIRVLPSLSKPDSLRIEPSIYISDESMDACCNALIELCKLCRNKEIYLLLKFLMNDDPYLDKTEKVFEGCFPVKIEQPVAGALKVGFIGNFTMPPKELALIEPDLKKASDTGLRILFGKMQSLLEGKSIHLFSKNLLNGRVNFTFSILPFDTAHLELVSRWGKKRFYISRIQETVDKLSKQGASHISLGAHTSILTGNGIFLAENRDTKILTGNTLTVASCLYHLEQYLEKLQQKGENICIAIAGANGNIGAGLAGCFKNEKYEGVKILLIGNNLKKLELLKRKLFDESTRVEITNDFFRIREADILVSCTNTNDPLIFEHHINPLKKLFIIDLAVPSSVADEVKRISNVEFCKEASTVYLPGDPDLLVSTHTPKGKIFCCAAEVMLATLYDVQLPLKGHIHPDSIREMMRLAEMEGLFKQVMNATAV
jgi:acetylornithine/succinyldiaminopimelate/putrescine aminotransferase/acyl-coenzyme A synthetase/AMP-(fatty) acid ligase/predicted amino acid dehydrogenase